jgi:hypothetical protein
MLTIITKCIKTISLIIAAMNTAMLLWKTFSAPAQQVPQARLKLAEATAERFIVQLRQYRAKSKSAIVLHLDNDPTHCVTRAIRRRIRETGILNLPNETFAEHFKTSFNLPVDGCSNEQDAMHIAEEISQDLLIYGTVERFELDCNGHPVLTGELHVIDTVSMEKVFSFTMEDSSVPSELQPPEQVAVASQTEDISVFGRLASFILMSILVPFIFFPQIRKLAAKRSNNINLALLTALTIFDTALSMALLAKIISFLPFQWFLLFTITISIFCNLFIINYATKLENT